MEHAIQRAKVLVEALPYIRDLWGRRVVVKYGGHAMVDPELKRLFARQIVLFQHIGIQVVVVHGGGPQITSMLDMMGIETRFVEGKRVTDAKTMDVVEMVLAGGINKEIVHLINAEGGRAVGLSGKDGRLIRARKLYSSRTHPDGTVTRDLDIGHVGEVEEIDPSVIDAVEKAGYVAVIAPSGVGSDGLTYNINADTVASGIAARLKVEKLVILTDEAGVLDADGRLISSLTTSEIPALVKRGVVTGGMIPKLECCVEALEAGVVKAHIVDGRVPYSIMLELFTDSGIGTQVVKG
ncbi:MAG TPA: acetylglutamate kinase [Deltaproteobacteria bacterium]|nr:acetylglutamate kinase [Deltaproteobacteria bacterium]HOM29690.1 acetylglutamate kinase [Deltaproteobacteria bacterium]HPP80334.1 acetylglutamate kinase [Deltaproteobacteria bacterium]